MLAVQENIPQASVKKQSSAIAFIIAAEGMMPVKANKTLAKNLRGRAEKHDKDRGG